MKILSDIKIIDCPNCYGTGRVEDNNICGCCRGAGRFQSVLEIVKKTIRNFYMGFLQEDFICRKLTEAEIDLLFLMLQLKYKISKPQLIDVLETYRGKYFYEM